MLNVQSLEVRRKKTIISLIIVVVASVLLYFILMVIYNSNMAVKNENSVNENIMLNPTTSDIIEEIFANNKHEDLIKLKDVSVSNYYEFPDGLVAENTIYISKTTDSPQEVACFKLADEDYYPQLNEILEQHVNQRLSSFKTEKSNLDSIYNYTIEKNEEFMLLSIGSNSTKDKAVFQHLDLQYE